MHDDVIKLKHFSRYWPFVRGIHRSTVNSPQKGQWRGALMLSLMCALINSWVNNGEAGDLRRYRHHYDVIVMVSHTRKENVFWRKFCYCLQRKLSLWQLSSLPVTKICRYDRISFQGMIRPIWYLYLLVILLCIYWEHCKRSLLTPKCWHYDDVIMGAMASQITSLTIVYSTVYSDADQRKHQSSVSPTFMREIHRGPVNSPHRWPVTRKMSPFDDVIMIICLWLDSFSQWYFCDSWQHWFR